MVGHILAQCQTAVCMQTGQHFDAIVELTHHLNALCEALSIFVTPPLTQVTFFVVLSTLIVESVCHLMSDNYTDSPIIESIVGLHIEEWWLQNACREANLIGRGVVISIHRLWGHEPFVVVYGLVKFRAYHFFNLPLVAGQNIA